MNHGKITSLIANSSGVLTRTDVVDLADLTLRRQAHENAQAEFRAQAQDAARRNDDHGPALAENAERDQLARCTATAKAMLSNGRSLMGLADDVDDLEPDDSEIFDVLMTTFGMSKEEVVIRLRAFVAKLDADAENAAEDFADNYNEKE